MMITDNALDSRIAVNPRLPILVSTKKIAIDDCVKYNQTGRMKWYINYNTLNCNGMTILGHGTCLAGLIGSLRNDLHGVCGIFSDNRNVGKTQYTQQILMLIGLRMLVEVTLLTPMPQCWRPQICVYTFLYISALTRFLYEVL